MGSEKTQKFTAAYKQLEEIANRLKNEEIMDVDELIQQVEMASKNYKFCKERLEGAQKKLNSILEDPTIDEMKTTGPNSDSQFQDDDSDMPF